MATSLSERVANWSLPWFTVSGDWGDPPSQHVAGDAGAGLLGLPGATAPAAVRAALPPDGGAGRAGARSLHVPPAAPRVALRSTRGSTPRDGGFGGSGGASTGRL